MNYNYILFFVLPDITLVCLSLDIGMRYKGDYVTIRMLLPNIHGFDITLT